MKKTVSEKTPYKILRIFNNKNTSDDVVRQIIVIKNNKNSDKE